MTLQGSKAWCLFAQGGLKEKVLVDCLYPLIAAPLAEKTAVKKDALSVLGRCEEFKCVKVCSNACPRHALIMHMCLQLTLTHTHTHTHTGKWSACILSCVQSGNTWTWQLDEDLWEPEGSDGKTYALNATD